MKKSLLTIALIGIIGFSCVMAATAATVTYTKPTINVNTSEEESAISKKINETKANIEKAKADAEKAKADAKAKKEANKKEAEAKKKQRQDAINSFKDSFKTN